MKVYETMNEYERKTIKVYEMQQLLWKRVWNKYDQSTKSNNYYERRYETMKESITTNNNTITTTTILL